MARFSWRMVRVFLGGMLFSQLVECAHGWVFPVDDWRAVLVLNVSLVLGTFLIARFGHIICGKFGFSFIDPITQKQTENAEPQLHQTSSQQLQQQQEAPLNAKTPPTTQEKATEIRQEEVKLPEATEEPPIPLLDPTQEEAKTPSTGRSHFYRKLAVDSTVTCILRKRDLAIFAAVESGDAKKVDELLTASKDRVYPIETDHRWRTVLHLAVEHGHEEVVDVMMGHKDIDVYARDCGGFNALHMAVELGHDKIVARLLEKEPCLVGQKVRKQSESKVKKLNALHLAAIKGHVSIAKQLLAIKPDLIDDWFSLSPLKLAINHGHEEFAVMLVESVKSSCYEKEMLAFAIRSGYDNVAAKLLSQSPGLIDAADILYGRNALQLAAEHGRGKLVGHFLALKPHLIDSLDTSREALGVLHIAAQYDQPSVVAQLLAVKPTLATSQITTQGQTALHLAAQQLHDKCVEELLARNPELVDAKDDDGNTALHLAFTSVRSPGRHFSTVTALLARRPAVIDQQVLELALKGASEAADDEAIKLLLSHKPELIATSNNNNNGNALHQVFGFRKRESPHRRDEPPAPEQKKNEKNKEKKKEEKKNEEKKQPLFSEELMTIVWQLSEQHEALRQPDEESKETPFHVAIRSGNKFAIELVQGKLSLDEIVEAYDKCDKKCALLLPSLLDRICSEALLEPLDNKERTVCEFLWMQSV